MDADPKGLTTMTHQPHFYVAGDFTYSSVLCEDCLTAQVEASGYEVRSDVSYIEPIGNVDGVDAEDAWSISAVYDWDLGEWADGATCEGCLTEVFEGYPSDEYVSAFQRGYVECAEWLTDSDLGEDVECDGWSYGVESTLEDVARTFVEQRWGLLRRALAHGLSASQAGHDLWLTQNRHGAGYWDRGLPEDLGHALTTAAHAEGSLGFTLGDDGLAELY